MSEPAGWIVKSIYIRPGASAPSFDLFDATYLDPVQAVEAVKRVCGGHSIVEVVEELVATDLGPNKVRAR